MILMTQLESKCMLQCIMIWREKLIDVKVAYGLIFLA